jgi:hypothetical protein
MEDCFGKMKVRTETSHKRKEALIIPGITEVRLKTLRRLGKVESNCLEEMKVETIRALKDQKDANAAILFIRQTLSIETIRGNLTDYKLPFLFPK